MFFRTANNDLIVLGAGVAPKRHALPGVAAQVAVFGGLTPATQGGFKPFDALGEEVDLAAITDQTGATRTWSIGGTTSSLIADGTPDVDDGVVVTCETVGGQLVEITIKSAGTDDHGHNLDVARSVRLSSQLSSALSAAAEGEIILMRPTAERYDSWHYTDRPVITAVTVTSHDPTNLARFQWVDLTNVSHVTFDKIMLDYRGASWSPELMPFNINGGSKFITIQNSVFQGVLADDTFGAEGKGAGIGLRVHASEDVTIHNNVFYHWFYGIRFTYSTRSVITNNELHTIRSDGFQATALTVALIENNLIRDFDGTIGDHSDMIQFFTLNQNVPSTDITIRLNFLDSGAGGQGQSIFLANEAVNSQGAGTEMYYQNILIEENIIYNSQPAGVNMGAADGVTIRKNTVLHNQNIAAGNIAESPTFNVSGLAVNVTIADNIVPERSNLSPGPHAWGLVVQFTDALADYYIGDLFIDALSGADATLADLRAVPDGLIYTMEVGALVTRGGSSIWE